MNFIKICFTSLMVMSCFKQVTAQDRSSLYLHGLGGNSTNWAGWAALFHAERTMNSGDNRPYTSQNGVANYAGQVPVLPNNNTIAFGHSAGGIVARHLAMTRTNPFGGIITAGAPLDGARIANNFTNGQATNFILNGVDKILKGPIRELGPAAGQLYEVANHRFRNMAEAYIQSVINNLFGGQTLTDLSENSAYMNNGFRTTSTAMPKVHIYGNENSPVLWRIAAIQGGWADPYLVSITQQARDICITKRAFYTNLAFINPVLAPGYLHIADGWETSANWIQSGSETGWNDLIGSTIPATKSVVSPVIDWSAVNQCLSQYSQATYQQYQQCQQQNTQYVTYTYYSPVNSLSDAWHKAPSATGYNSTWSDNATKLEALGVNHLEMKDHPEMRNIYNRIFDGGTANNFFITIRRP